MVFGFAYDNEMIEKPIRFSQQFARPSKKTMRLHRARKQEKHRLRMFEDQWASVFAHESSSLISVRQTDNYNPATGTTGGLPTIARINDEIRVLNLLG